MAATFNKPANMNYTDLAIWIDANLPKLKNTGEYPEVEQKIYEYLYHMFYAFARKANYFPKMVDYDEYALFAAGQTYMAFKNSYVHEGEIRRGKVVERITGSLNFVNAVMFPLKCRYTKAEYAEIINPENGQDTTILEKDMKVAINSDYASDLLDDLSAVFEDIYPIISNKVLPKIRSKDPVRTDNIIYSIMLTLINTFYIPNIYRKILKKKPTKQINFQINDLDKVVLWHLPESYHDLILLLSRKARFQIEKAISDERSYSELSDDILKAIMDTAYATYNSYDGD